MGREFLRLETGSEIATAIPNSTTNTITSNRQQQQEQQNDNGFIYNSANQNLQQNPTDQAGAWIKIINDTAATAATSPYEYLKPSSFVRLDNIQQQALIRAKNSSSIDHGPYAASNEISIKSGGQTSGYVSDAILNYVDLSIVRNMIAQYIIEIAIISVILVYLFYYFRKISQLPRLIGNENSDFYKHIKENLNDILDKRFSPLVYFWGTNPQTALFGYLLGKSSEKEMPRSKFKRQYLYVSDIQYLTSNVNLSEHYIEKNEMSQNQQQHPQRIENSTSVVKRRQLVPLNAADLCTPTATISLLDQNIRLALESMARSNDKSSSIHSMSDRSCSSSGSSRSVTNTTGSDSPSSETDYTQSTAPFSTNIDHSNHQQSVTGMQNPDQQQELSQQQQQRPRSYCEDKHHSRDKPLGSSSGDSGVFASNSSSSASSSASSLTINIENNTDETRCNCLRLYRDNSVERFIQPNAAVATAAAAAKATKTMTLDCDNYQQMNERFDGLDSEPSINNKQHHLQQESSNIPVERERLEFGQCALDWFEPSHRNYHRNKLVALISAGMTTGSDKKYVTDTVATLNELGYEVCVFIRRGVGGLKLSSARFFSPSKWRDFEAAIHSVRRQRPNARLVAIGFSFGSIELCRYLSMSGERSLVDSALLVSCPFDPEAGGRNMRKRVLNRRIDAYLAKNLGKQLYQALFNTIDSQTLTELGINKDGLFTNQNGSVIDLATLPKVKSLVDFEKKYNRIIQNYPNSEAYAADSRLHEILSAIRTPTLCISSEDDFMAPLKLLPLDQIRQNKNLCMVLTKRGGHMAFVDGLVWPTKPYFAQRIVNKYMGAFKLKNSSSTEYSTTNLNNSNTFMDTSCEQQQINAQEQKLHHLIKVYR